MEYRKKVIHLKTYSPTPTPTSYMPEKRAIQEILVRERGTYIFNPTRAKILAG